MFTYSSSRSSFVSKYPHSSIFLLTLFKLMSDGRNSGFVHICLYCFSEIILTLALLLILNWIWEFMTKSIEDHSASRSSLSHRFTDPMKYSSVFSNVTAAFVLAFVFVCLQHFWKCPVLLHFLHFASFAGHFPDECNHRAS